MKYKALIKLKCIYNKNVDSGEIFEIREIIYNGDNIKIITLDDKEIPLEFLNKFCIELTGEEGAADDLMNRVTDIDDGSTSNKFKEDKNVWDPKYKEVFRYVHARDKVIEDRLERYSHQDGSYYNLCDCEYCRCQE